MKAFEYAAPQTEAEVLQVLSPEAGETEVLAGGTDLVGLMKKMVVTPQRVVNIMDVLSLKQIETLGDGGVRIGAAVTLDEVLEHPALCDYPAVTQAIRGINSMQLQAQGTIGGELCQRPRCWYFRDGRGLLAAGGKLIAEGDNRLHAIFGNQGAAKFVSASRLAPALVALGASLRVLGPTSDDESLIGVEQFYRTPRHEGERETVLSPGQYVTHVILPPATDLRSATYEVRDTAGPDYPLTAAAAALEMNGPIVHDARIVMGHVAPTPWVSPEARERIIGQAVSYDLAEAAGQAAVVRATPLSGNQYKVQLAKVAVKRAILLAAGLQTGGF